MTLLSYKFEELKVWKYVTKGQPWEHGNVKNLLRLLCHGGDGKEAVDAASEDGLLPV